MRCAQQTFPSLRRWLGLLALVLLLAGCGHSRNVREDGDYRPRPHPAAAPPRHAGAGEVMVVRGDTLYGIAFRNGMDFRDLAALNGIAPPYTIYVGQVLRLRGRVRAAPRSDSSVRAQPRPPERSSLPTQRPPPAHPSANAHPPTNAHVDVNPQATAGVQPAPARVAPPPTAPVTDVAPPAPSAAILPADTAFAGGIRWRWPAGGSLIGRFVAGDATRQGIDIAGRAGDPVLAAAGGVVVYSGSGLVGYGELVIIKHSDEWLSAYGHNRKRLVVEGQRVTAGQPIAEMGNSGASRDELHFEIRRNGRPVDPLQFLPAR